MKTELGNVKFTLTSIGSSSNKKWPLTYLCPFERNTLHLKTPNLKVNLLSNQNTWPQ